MGEEMEECLWRFGDLVGCNALSNLVEAAFWPLEAISNRGCALGTFGQGAGKLLKGLGRLPMGEYTT